MGETMDVIVVGESTDFAVVAGSSSVTAGNYGSGKRAGGVSTLICAVRDDRRNPNSKTQASFPPSMCRH